MSIKNNKLRPFAIQARIFSAFRFIIFSSYSFIITVIANLTILQNYKVLFSIFQNIILLIKNYMDTSNWITSMQGGAQFGYILLFVILLSSLSAMLLQSMTVRLGIATGMDLAQATKYYLNKPLSFVFWIIAELAIIATDIAEVI